MMLAVADASATAVGVDLVDKVPVAAENLASRATDCPFSPFDKQRFELLGGDAFDFLSRWKAEGRRFDVVYSGCSLDPRTEQLKLFLEAMKPSGAAVFNLGNPGQQGMYFVADGGKVCQLLLRVNFMMAESPATPPILRNQVPLEPDRLGAWIRANVAFSSPPEL
mmetsp:Transcript_39592/g.91507  ORF Transcript_39592/g.91507 Transcript_39592/m.91507 type:complete len:165 (-) Transcript_39592:38-532(-)